MKQMARVSLALVGLLASVAPHALLAQTGTTPNNTGYATTSAEFLLLGAGARGTALGGSFSAIVSDVSSLYYNPAGLALMSRPGIMVGTYDYVASTRYSWGGVAFPFSGGSRAIGLQLGTFGFKDQPVTTPDQPDGTGATYSVSETFAGLTLAQDFSDRFAAGFTVKGVFDQLGSVSGRAFAVDFGTNFHANLSGHPVKLGFTVTNLGTKLSYTGSDLNRTITRDTSNAGGQEPQPAQLKTKGFSLPTTFQVALSYDVLAGTNNRLSVISSFNQPNNNRAGFGAGAEWNLNHLGGSGFGAAVRGSYSFAPANNVTLADPSQTALTDEENLQGLAVGGGLNYTTGSVSLGVDYAFKYMGVLGATNFVSVSLGW
jgi:hypothetical protein